MMQIPLETIGEKQRLLGQFFRLSSNQQELLKYVALVAMTLDHIGLMYYSTIHPLHSIVGRFVFPAFGFMLIYNYIYRTRDKKKYLMRLFIAAVISQPIYVYALNTYSLNILFSLFFGMFIIYIYEERPALTPYLSANRSTQKLLSISIVLISIILTITLATYLSYSVFGLFMMFMFYGLLKHPSPAYMAGLIIALVLINVRSMSDYQIASTLLFLPVFTIIKISRIKIKRISGLWFYAFYPAHLLLLSLFRG